MVRSQVRPFRVARLVPAAPSASFSAALSEFFSEWWDTVYPPGGGANSRRPQITADGLDGGGFHC